MLLVLLLGLLTCSRAENTSSTSRFQPFMTNILPIADVSSTNQLTAAIGRGNISASSRCIAPLKQSGAEEECTTLRFSGPGECTSVRNDSTSVPVYGVGTMLRGAVQNIWCCSEGVQASLSAPPSSECEPAVVITADVSDILRDNIIIGSVSQLHRLDTQILVARFMSLPEPYLCVAVGAGAALLHMLASGGDVRDPQARLDGCKVAFVVTLLVDGLLYAFLLLSKEFDWSFSDPITVLSKIGELAVGIFGLLYKPCFRTYSGEGKIACGVKGATVATGAFASFGSLGAAIPLLQSALNACQRVRELRMPTTANVRP